MADDRADKLVRKAEAVTLTTYSDVVKNRVRMLVENSSKSISEIGRETGVPAELITIWAAHYNWAMVREKNEFRRAEENLERIADQLANQFSDLVDHYTAEIEAIQYSFRIKIQRDSTGRVHYRKFEEDLKAEIPDWDSLTEPEQETLRRTIELNHFLRFCMVLNDLLERRKAAGEFIAKNTKASLPKVSPDKIDLDRREGRDDVVIDARLVKKSPPSAPPTTPPGKKGK